MFSESKKYVCFRKRCCQFYSSFTQSMCNSFSNFSEKRKQNLTNTCAVECQESYSKRDTRLLHAQEKKGSNSSIIHPYCVLSGMRNTLKIPWKRNRSRSQSSACFLPALSLPLVFNVTIENFSCYHVCSPQHPQYLHLFSSFFHSCHPNPDLLTKGWHPGSEPAH